MKALLVLEDGSVFRCKSFTGHGEVGGEIVFNTSIVGYQEILTDPSYYGKMVVMTYPMIGNYGVNFEDIESHTIYISVFLIKEYQYYYSNFRSKGSLLDYLSYYGVIGIEDLDTRTLTRHISKFGSMRAYISTRNFDYYSLVFKTRFIPNSVGLELVSKVSVTKIYKWGCKGASILKTELYEKNIFCSLNKSKSIIVVLDYGLKISVLRQLLLYDFEIVVVPANTSLNIINRINPKGILLSNGPGDPSSVIYAIEMVKKLFVKKIPIFGICLGHQILGLAMGAKTYKLKFGHRGSNQPVKNLYTGKVEMSVQNHEFAISSDSLKNCDIEITHVNLNDNTIEGIKHKYMPFFSIQYHPEAAPGPRDSVYFFEKFKNLVNKF